MFRTQGGAGVAAPAAGHVIGGKYRLERVIGRGGMGVVMEARHLTLDEPVAVKFLLKFESDEHAHRTRFEREARLAAKIKSEHVCRVFDYGILDDGQPYMVMDYLAGESLSDVLRTEGPLEPRRAVGYLLQACEAVAEAHMRGIVHRDLKPSNLFLTDGPYGDLVKVVDFGVSKRMHHDSATDDPITGRDMVVGTISYMAPEQARNATTVDGRADIWSLGALLYRLLSGVRPFGEGSAIEVLSNVVYSSPPSLREACPAVPIELERVVLRCLEKDPAERFQTVTELAEALEPFAPGAYAGWQQPAVSHAGLRSSHSSFSGAGAKQVQFLTAEDQTQPMMRVVDEDTVDKTWLSEARRHASRGAGFAGFGLLVAGAVLSAIVMGPAEETTLAPATLGLREAALSKARSSKPQLRVRFDLPVMAASSAVIKEASSAPPKRALR